MLSKLFNNIDKEKASERIGAQSYTHPEYVDMITIVPTIVVSDARSMELLPLKSYLTYSTENRMYRAASKEEIINRFIDMNAGRTLFLTQSASLVPINEIKAILFDDIKTEKKLFTDVFGNINL